MRHVRTLLCFNEVTTFVRAPVMMYRVLNGLVNELCFPCGLQVRRKHGAAAGRQPAQVSQQRHLSDPRENSRG